MYKTRYSRQIMLPDFGEEGQRRLSVAKVLIVGLGGLGAPVASYLAGAGVGTIGLCDPDSVGLSNLQRQILYTSEEIGELKTDIALRRLKQQNPDISLITFPDGLTEDNAGSIISRFNLVIDCTDNFKTRFLIDRVCMEFNIPWVYGAIGEFNGQVSVMNYAPSPRHLSELFPELKDISSFPNEILGVIGAVPGVIGSIQACEAIKILAGIGEPLAGKLFMIDLLTLNTQIITY